MIDGTAPPMRHDVICLSTNHWSGLPTSKQALMTEMARSVRVLYVEPPMDVFSVLGRRRRWPKLRGLREVRRDLWVLSSVALSASSDPAKRARGYARALPRVAAAAERVGLRDRVLWCFAPEHVVCAGRLDEVAVVYSAADEPEAFSSSPDVTKGLERRMLHAADLVLVVSESLLSARSSHPDVHRLPNAADVPHFKRVLAGSDAATDDELFAALAKPAVPADLARFGRPLVMYGGAAYGWFDFDLVRGVAEARPEWTIVLVGPGGGEQRLPGNVVRLGRRPYDVFPRYIAACDAGMIPWRDGLFARNADPIILYQYLLCGKPVVATPFPAAVERGALVDVADGVDAFVPALERALAEDPGAAVRRDRMAFGLANTWRDRAATAAELINAAVGGGALARTGGPLRRGRSDDALRARPEGVE
jgi:UDP-galactopyranose mutase